MRKINILQIITLTLEAIKQKPKDFLRFGSPLILMPLIWWASDKLDIDIWDPIATSSFLISLIAYLSIVIVLALTLVGCHRTFLMHNNDIDTTKTFRFGIREWNFMAWWIRIGFIILPLFVIQFILLDFIFDIENQLSEFGFYISSIPAMYVVSRLSLAFPATAVNNTNTSISKIWKLCSGNGWRLTLLIGLIPLITSMLLESLPVYNSIFYYISSSALWLIIGLFEVGLLSMSYAYLSGYIDDE